MATSWEEKKAASAAAAKQREFVRSGAGTVVEAGVKHVTQSAVRSGGAAATAAKGFNTASIVGTVIEFAGAIGIAAWQYVSGKRKATEERRKTRKQEFSQTGIDDILSIIEGTGTVVVQEHGIDPTTAEFEKILFDNLYKVIGYSGNCNITAPRPGKTLEEGSPIWFKVTGNGRIFKPVSMQVVPPNIKTYWRVRCKSLRDTWANLYQDLLIQQGRVRELEAFQADYNKGKKILRVSFGIIFAILIVIAVRYGVKIK